MTVSKEKKKTNKSLLILDGSTRLLLCTIIAIAVSFGLLTYTNAKRNRERELNPPEIPSQTMLKMIYDREDLYIEDGVYHIHLTPEANIFNAIYRAKTYADGKPFKIYQLEDIAESSDGSCYCIFNGEPIATRKDLAVKLNFDKRDLTTLEMLTPQEWDSYNRYMNLESKYQLSDPSKATRTVADELGMSQDDAACYLQNSYNILMGHHKRLSPEVLRENIFTPALTYHPGTDGCNISAGYATAMITYFISGYHIHLEEQDYVNQMMIDATALLTEEERTQLKEGMPDLIALEDETIATYPANRSIYLECGNYELTDLAINVPSYKDDWAKTRAALIAAGFSAESATT